jgi:steroid delta-isomerase-like uncharacterized protein
MATADESVVRRFFEEMCNGRKNELAPELFAADHTFHDPQVPAAQGPQGMADAVSAYQNGVNGHWEIQELFSAGDRVVVRWVGSGTHVGDMNGIPPTGKSVRVEAISIHRVRDGKIAETWEVWDTLGFLQQLGVVPTPEAAKSTT